MRAVIGTRGNELQSSVASGRQNGAAFEPRRNYDLEDLEMALRRTEDDLAGMRLTKGSYTADQRSVEDETAIKQEPHDLSDEESDAEFKMDIDQDVSIKREPNDSSDDEYDVHVEPGIEQGVAVKGEPRDSDDGNSPIEANAHEGEIQRIRSGNPQNLAYQFNIPPGKKGRRNLAKKLRKGKLEPPMSTLFRTDMHELTADSRQYTVPTRKARVEAFCVLVDIACKGRNAKQCAKIETCLAQTIYKLGVADHRKPQAGWIAGLERIWATPDGHSPFTGRLVSRGMQAEAIGSAGAQKGRRIRGVEPDSKYRLPKCKTQ